MSVWAGGRTGFETENQITPERKVKRNAAKKEREAKDLEKWKREKELKKMEGTVKLLQLKRKKDAATATYEAADSADDENKNKNNNPLKNLKIPPDAEGKNSEELKPESKKRKRQEKKDVKEKKMKVS